MKRGLHPIRLTLFAFSVTLWVMGSATILSAQTVYDCKAEENRDKPTTVEIVLSKKWKDHVEEIKGAFAGGTKTVKVRLQFFPFLDPPTNIGIGKCVAAEEARSAIRGAVQYNRGIDRLIVQDVLPHHLIKIGATDLAEIGWIPISADDLTRLSDPSLSTEQFQELYRRLATPKERKRPFGMGSEKLEEKP